MNVVRRIAAVLIGLILFFAGFLKLMDPVGTSLIMEEYFRFLHIGFLFPAAFGLGLAFSLTETIVGIALVTGVWRKTFAVISGLLLAFFTLLTLATLIFNPDMNCGCFGKAITLTHRQSFLKNIILCLLWITAFVPFRKLETPHKIKYAGFSVATAAIVLFAVYSSCGIPAIDYTPFTPGVELFGSGLHNEDAPVLSFFNDDMEYCDSAALELKLLVVSVYDPGKLNEKRWGDIRNFLSDAESQEYNTMVLVATVPGEFDTELPCPHYYCDRKTLLTFNRSNGGVTLMDGGEILAKWPAIRRPSEEKLADLKNYSATELMIDENNRGNLLVQIFFTCVAAIMLLL